MEIENFKLVKISEGKKVEIVELKDRSYNC